MDLILNKEKTKENLNEILKEFIESSRSTLDEKINNIILMLKSLKEESEKNISKITEFCEKNKPNLLINNNIIINQNLRDSKAKNSIDNETKNTKQKIQIIKNKKKFFDKNKPLKKFNTSYLSDLKKSYTSSYNLNKGILNKTLPNANKRKNSSLNNDKDSKKNKIIIRNFKKSKSIVLPEEKEKEKQNSKNNLTNPGTHSKNSKTSLIKISNTKKLSPKEKAILILCKSPTLRLCEQLIFSRSSRLVKEKTTINDLLRNHLITLENKIRELKNEIFLCTSRIKKPFVASKIADITLNFITAADEQEFKEFDNMNIPKNEKEFYYNFIKILYLIFNEKLDNKLDKISLKQNLFMKIFAKGFNIKDYFYFCYISNDINKPNFVVKIDEINKIIKKEPNLLDINETLKTCRFINFSIYLIKDIVNYANNIRDIVELKLKAENFLEIVINKKNKTKNRLSQNLKVKK